MFFEGVMVSSVLDMLMIVSVTHPIEMSNEKLNLELTDLSGNI